MLPLNKLLIRLNSFYFAASLLLFPAEVNARTELTLTGEGAIEPLPGQMTYIELARSATETRELSQKRRLKGDPKRTPGCSDTYPPL